MLSVYIHHECHGTDMGRNLGYSSTGCRKEQSVIQQYAPLHQTSGEGIIGRRGDTTEAEQHLQFGTRGDTFGLYRPCQRLIGVDAKSAEYLKFHGKYKTVIPAGKAIDSDPLKFNLRPLERVAITINYTSSPAKPTMHPGSRTTSYIMKGVTNAHSNFEKAQRVNHWYTIAGIDVYTMKNNLSAIAIIGNSITDGRGTTDNAQNRWPDIMSEMLHLKHKITNQGVLNLGIGSNQVVVPGGIGTLAKDRYDRDILGQCGVKKVIIFEGINDIGNTKSGNSETTARLLIESYQNMIKKAKAKRMKVYLATITPFKGAGYYTYFHEACRQYVNDWIRNQGKEKKVDGVLDFAKLMQDSADEHRMKKEYVCSDWLHPNAAGYKVMGIYAAEIVK